MNAKITSERLRGDGWKLDRWTMEKLSWESYNKTFIVNGMSLLCSIQRISNHPFREWNLHVDNDCSESIGSMDVETFEQIEKFLDLLTEK